MLKWSITRNIRKFGRTARGVQRYQCKTYKKTFIKPRRKTLRFSGRDIRRVPFKEVAWEAG